MVQKKRIAIILVLMLFLLPSVKNASVKAQETIDFNVKVSPSKVIPGNQAEAVISLVGYTNEMAEHDAIRGVQVDITGIDTSIVTVEKYESLIDDTTAISNMASYNKEKERVRLVYVQLNDTLPAPCEDILKVVFQVNKQLNQDDSIILPVTVKIQTMAKRITLTGECRINYSTKNEVVSVDIEWGNMEFEYSDGLWNTKTHEYENAGWTDNGSGYITVKNTGTAIATATFSYCTEQANILGEFFNGKSVIETPIKISEEDEITVHLILSGKPKTEFNNEKIGSVTVTIGGE